MTDERLTALLEHRDAKRMLMRYGLALDSHDWPLLRRCFTPDAVFDFGERRGVGEGIEAIVRTCHRALAGLDASQHLLGTCVVDLDGDAGTASTYVQAQHYLLTAKAGNTFTVGGRYVDRLARTDDGWRIAHRQLVTLWTEGNIGVFAEAEARLRERGEEEPAT
ncbi:MAG: nuclear transport factor 2 family protein [Solirubrobacterales bacterium]|nr:nuclear transport factor 2 family protein [Solirubrobacterales bacterium]